MVEELSKEKIAMFKEAFCVYDVDSDGRVMWEEAGVVIRSLGVQLSQKKLRSLRRRIDIEKTGLVDFPQFLSILAEMYTEDKQEDERVIVESFKLFDKHNNGRISAQDLRYVLVTLGETLSAEEADRLLMEADKDGQGQIDYTEFAKVLCNV